MVLLTRIYTKSGDKGKTSLGDGQRIEKFDLRIAAIGDVDEANSVIGLIRAKKVPDVANVLRRIQNDLFDCGADLCIPEGTVRKLSIQEDHINFLESTIDHYNQFLSPLTSFVLPGGSMLSSKCHLARTIVRRAERSVCMLANKQTINHCVVIYLNRLSDLMFVLARYLNDQGKADVLWQPGQSIATNT